MAVFGTSDAAVLMQRNIADGMITEARSTSVIARLSGREPMRFGDTDYLIFNDFPKAEFVEEGAEKSSTTRLLLRLSSFRGSTTAPLACSLVVGCLRNSQLRTAGLLA